MNIMKLQLSVWVALLSVVCATSCGDDGDSGGKSTEQILSFCPVIAESQNDYATSMISQFEVGDCLSISLWEGDVPPPAQENLYLDNITAECIAEGEWQLSQSLDIDKLTATYNIAALYPPTTAKGVEELQDVEIDTNSDWVYGSLRTKLSVQEVEIECYPLLAELSFSLLDGSVVDNVEIEGLATSGTLNMFDGKITILSQDETVVFEESSVGYSSKLLPQSIKNFQLTSNGRIYTYSGTTIALSSGDMCDVELSLLTDGTISISSIVITPWEEYDGNDNYSDLELTTNQN